MLETAGELFRDVEAFRAEMTELLQRRFRSEVAAYSKLKTRNLTLDLIERPSGISKLGTGLILCCPLEVKNKPLATFVSIP
jgi:hypothetical protein